MTKRIQGPKGREHYKVRIVLHGAIIHLASSDEPSLVFDPWQTGALKAVEADWLNDPELGDALGWIDWPAVRAVTWRWTGEA